MKITDVQTQLHLPSVSSIECSERAFGEAFLVAAKILVQHLEQIQAAIEVDKSFASEPFNSDILDLFGKMSCHYYSYVLFETSHNQTGSQFLIEHLNEVGITLTYLIETREEDVYSEYISASVCQSHRLLTAVKEQLHKFPNHSNLLGLKIQLETVIADQQEHVIANRPLSANPSEVQLSESRLANTTAKRGVIAGLNFLTNPARQIALKVIPASWLEIQLNYLDSLANSSHIGVQPKSNFRNLRDASHLCLHVTQIFLDEIVGYQGFILTDLERHEHMFNILFEWFYEANNVCQAPSGRRV